MLRLSILLEFLDSMKSYKESYNKENLKII
jgi:hypothetical protein